MNRSAPHARWKKAGLVSAVAVGLAITSAGPVWACSDAHRQPAGAATTSTAASARSVEPGQIDRAAPPGESENVEFVGNLPGTVGTTALNFLEYGKHRSVMFVTGTFGLKAFDVTEPDTPVLLDSLDMPGFWENEDMDVDPRRKLVFLSRDPRAFGGDQATGESGIYIVSARDPENLTILSYADVPAGHTTSCVNSCKYLWTGGPAPSDDMPDSWGGRPIWVTDIRNPRRPHVHPEPVDMHRNDGKTDYAHDVQVDDHGVAWVSGQGGIRGYWTKGRHYDPVAERPRVATPTDPVPYAGGKFVQQPDVGYPGGAFAHNSLRPVDAVGDFAPGEIAFVTIENFSADCSTDGRLVAVSLAGSTDGQAWRSTPQDPYRLDIVGEWTPYGKEGSRPGTGCSAHYFQLRDGVIAQSFYGEGTRFVDVTDPADPTQVAYYRPEGGRAWAPYWHGDTMYVADFDRGVDIVEPNITDAG